HSCGLSRRPRPIVGPALVVRVVGVDHGVDRDMPTAPVTGESIESAPARWQLDHAESIVAEQATDGLELLARNEIQARRALDRHLSRGPDPAVGIHRVGVNLWK